MIIETICCLHSKPTSSLVRFLRDVNTKILQGLKENIEKTSPTLGRNAVYVKTVSFTPVAKLPL